MVALCDQWYLDYGDKDWKADVKVGKSKGFLVALNIGYRLILLHFPL